MLPGADRPGIANSDVLPGGKGPDAVRDQAVPAPVAAADGVSCPAGSGAKLPPGPSRSGIPPSAPAGASVMPGALGPVILASTPGNTRREKNDRR